MSTQIAVGSKVWVFDANKRVYAKDEKGRAFGPPIHREHWVEREVVSETSRSWIVGRGWEQIKVPKKGPRRGVCFSLQEVEQDCWVNSHRYRIAQAVERASYEQLIAIAEIVGFKPSA